MIIVGDNLGSLVKQFNICDLRLFDQFSLTIELDKYYCIPKKSEIPINYEGVSGDDYYEDLEMENGKLTIQPGQALLACSADRYKIPPGYIGFLQTKGSLARWMVVAHLCDGQVEPGFEGKITLEMVNFSPNPVEFNFRAKIAQLYLHRCTNLMDEEQYKGRYADSDKPTTPRLIGFE